MRKLQIARPYLSQNLTHQRLCRLRSPSSTHRTHGGPHPTANRGLSQSETSHTHDDLQKEVLRYIQRLTENTHLDAQTVERLKHHLSQQELMEVTFIIVLANRTNRFNIALRTKLP